MRTWRFKLILATFVLVLTGSACQKSSDLGNKKNLVFQVTAEPVSLDPSLAEDGAALRILVNVFEGLFGYDNEGKLVPRMAQKTEVSPDGLRWILSIREGARWSNGESVTAQDFVRGIKRSVDPKTGSKLAEMLSPIRDVSANQGRLVITLKYPTPHLDQILTIPAALPQPEGFLPSTRLSVFNGPYVIEKYDVEEQMILKKNSNYYLPLSQSAPEVVTLKIIKDESTAMRLFEKNQIDILSKISEYDLKRLKKDGRLKVYPFFATYFLGFNTRIQPFHRAENRRFVAAAIRKKEIADLLGFGETPADSWVPPGLEGYYQVSDKNSVVLPQGFDQQQKIVIGFDSGSRNQLVLEKVQQDLQGHGIQTELKNLDWKSYVGLLKTQPPMIYRMGWMAPYGDPFPHMQAYLGDNPNNYAGWKNAEYDRLVREIARTPSGLRRNKMLLRAQKILVDEEAVIVPIYHYVQSYAVQPRVQSFKVNAFGALRYDELRF